MTTFTSSLPAELLSRLQEISAKLNVPKNKLIQEALTKYLYELDRKMYIMSYKKLSNDPEINNMAEDSLEDYAKQLLNWDEEG